jgi:hypothetical protein
VRTTLTIDDDIASLVEKEMRQSGESFKGTVNRLLRAGLNAASETEPVKPFVVTPFPMGLKPGLNYDCIAELLEQVEGPYHR